VGVNTQDTLMVVFGVVAAGTAFYAVVTRYLLRAIIALGAFLTTVAAIFYLLAADFVAVIQIFVYVGGVVVLMLFALMLSVTGQRHAASDSDHSVLAVLVAYALGAWVVWAGWVAELPAVGKVPAQTVPLLGASFLGEQLFAFELIGVILLASLVAALVVIRAERQ
jgi:NADH-quinone oxidoreductase subunit J